MAIKTHCQKIDGVLAIQNYGSSGTLLIQSLLDGHPQILSLPALHGLHLLFFWDNHKDLSKTDLLDKFLTEHHYWFAPNADHDILGLMCLGPEQNQQASVDKNTFVELINFIWSDHEILTRKIFLTSVYCAYNIALGRNIEHCKYLLYPIHCRPQNYALQLSETFQHVKFLHMLREPVQGMGSLARHIAQHPDWQELELLTCVTAQILHDFTIHSGPYHAHGIIPYVNDSADGGIQSRAIRLEDVHRQSQATLRAVCHWLQINWDDCLLLSTFDGKLWHNRRESVKQTGIGTKTISQTHNDIISRFDRFRLQYLSYAIAKKFHYQNKFNLHQRLLLPLIPILLFWPFKMEWRRDRIKARVNTILEMKNPYHRHRHGRIATHFGHIPVIALFVILRAQLREFITCRRKWLLPAWRNIFNKKSSQYIELLTLDATHGS